MNTTLIPHVALEHCVAGALLVDLILPLALPCTLPFLAFLPLESQAFLLLTWETDGQDCPVDALDWDLSSQSHVATSARNNVK
jgi:hypothetical protein